MANIGYWPPNIPREETVTAFIAAYAIQGYAQRGDGALEAGFEKIVLYGVTLKIRRERPSEYGPVCRPCGG
jgi:hypothetical protein